MEYEDTVYEDEYEPLTKVNPVTGGGDYYYTPVTEPAGYGVSNTNTGSTLPATGTSEDTQAADGAAGDEAEEDEAEDQEEAATVNQQIPVEEAIPQPSGDEEEEGSGFGMLPGILLLAAAGIALGGGVFWFYRRNRYQG